MRGRDFEEQLAAKLGSAGFAFEREPSYLKKNFESKGVVDPDALLASLKSFFQSTRKASRRKRPSKSSDQIVFAAMPFSREYDDTFFVAMTHAAERVDAACKRVDRTEFSGDIVEEIRHLIAASIAVIVDLSESKPNVLYEAGYAHALQKPTVHICSTQMDDLPFDVRNWNTLRYERGRTSQLRGPLTRRLRAAVS